MSQHYESYIGRLKRLRREREEQREASKPPALSDQITTWWENLPASEQRLGYSMEFFKNRFGASPQQLGAILLSLGWQRQRRWETDRPYWRVWVRKG